MKLENGTLVSFCFLKVFRVAQIAKNIFLHAGLSGGWKFSKFKFTVTNSVDVCMVLKPPSLIATCFISDFSEDVLIFRIK